MSRLPVAQAVLPELIAAMQAAEESLTTIVEQEKALPVDRRVAYQHSHVNYLEKHDDLKESHKREMVKMGYWRGYGVAIDMGLLATNPWKYGASSQETQTYDLVSCGLISRRSVSVNK